MSEEIFIAVAQIILASLLLAFLATSLEYASSRGEASYADMACAFVGSFLLFPVLFVLNWINGPQVSAFLRFLWDHL